MALAVLCSSCFFSKFKKGTDDSDPIAVIENLSKEVAKSHDDWDEAAWKEAAQKLEEALANLPSPLETKEEITLSSAISKISIYADQHERKAAKMLEVLKNYEEQAATASLKSSYDMNGAVDKYPITMHIDIDGTQVKGTYYYNKKGPDATLKLSGSISGTTLDLNETDDNGVPTGHFEGELSDGVFKGVFTTNKGKKMPFAVGENGISASDLDDIYIEESNDLEESPAAGSSSDVDAMLDSYDNYVTKYISYVKKAANQDATALAEYPALMRQAQELSEKLERCKGEMTPAQLERYGNITMRMAKAAQELR